MRPPSRSFHSRSLSGVVRSAASFLARGRFFEPRLHAGAHRGKVRRRHEVFEVAVDENHEAVFVGFLAARASRRFDAISDEEAQHARKIVMAADARHVLEPRCDLGIAGRDEREAAREAEPEQAYRVPLDVIATLERVRDGVANHADATRRDAVIGELAELGRENHVPRARERPSERHEAAFVDALVVDAVRDDDAAALGVVCPKIQPCANRPVSRRNPHFLLGHALLGGARLSLRGLFAWARKVGKELDRPHPAHERPGREHRERDGKQGDEEPDLPPPSAHASTVAPNFSRARALRQLTTKNDDPRGIGCGLPRSPNSVLML